MTAIYQHFVRKMILHRTFMDWTGNCCFVRKMILHRTFMDWTGNCCFVHKKILHRTFMDWTGNCCYNRITSKYRCPADSGVFRISVRRGQGALGVNGVGCGEGAWPLPRKKSLLSQIDHLDTIFTRHEPWDTDFTVQSRNEAYKNSASFEYKNWHESVTMAATSCDLYNYHFASK